MKAGDNVIVARTFSKLHGLAGLRIGYALARPDLIEKMSTAEADRGEQPGAGGRHRELQRSQVPGCPAAAPSPRAWRSPRAALRDLKVRYVADQGEFRVFRHRKARRGIPRRRCARRASSLGRPFPPYDTWCRVSMGKVEEMQALSQRCCASTTLPDGTGPRIGRATGACGSIRLPDFRHAHD